MKRDRYEVKACEQCGYERRVRVSYRFSSEPSWSRTCLACDQESNVRYKRQQLVEAERKARKLRATQNARTANRVNRRLPSDRDVITHERAWSDTHGKSIPLCSKDAVPDRELRHSEAPEEVNCPRCRRKWVRLFQAELQRHVQEQADG